MNVSKYFLVVSIICCFATFVFGAKCPLTKCTCNGNIIDCRSLNLKNIPKLNTGAPVGPWQLNLKGNQITNIPAGSLPANLTSIDFTLNPIANISDQAFASSLESLEILRFQSAKFDRLPPALMDVTNLRTLSIYYTTINEWDLAILAHLGKSLHELSLRKVGLATWPQWGQLFPFLWTIEISDSPITTVPDDAFVHQINELENVKLRGSNLSSIPLAVRDMSHLRSLDLSYNKIELIEGIPKLSQLKYLSLGHNEISDVHHLVYDLFAFEETLIDLNLSGNKITVIPEFFHMTALRTVNLGFNAISDATLGSFTPNVTSLRLNRNFLTAVPDVVNTMQGLKKLYLSQNAITRVYATNFAPDSALESLWLDDNPLTTISDNAFRNIRHLKQLYLQNTKLTRVPIALASLVDLTTLSLQNVPDLVCTCEESDLVDWFLTHPNLYVDGTCGLNEIEYFFMILAIQCHS